MYCISLFARHYDIMPPQRGVRAYGTVPAPQMIVLIIIIIIVHFPARRLGLHQNFVDI